MTLDSLYIIYGLIVLAIILIAWIIHIERRLAKFMKGNTAGNLEDSLSLLHSKIEESSKTEQYIINTFKNIEGRLRKSAQNVETIRFDPYKDGSGMQSFATAILDEDGNGVVFSTLYSRDRTSFFAKPIRHYISEYELTKEEQEIVEKCKK